MTNMTTWQDFNESTGAGTSGSAATKWLYDTSRGWLSAKRYPLPSGEGQDEGPDYTYTAAGRLKSRAWVRGVTTWYTNNNAGELWVVNYTDTTADVTNTYDRRGRLTNVLSGATSLAKTYNDAGNLLRETYAGGPLNGLSVTNGYDHLLRRTNLSVLSPSSQLLTSTAYAYDPASRLLTVSDGANSATYDYLDNSPLVAQIAFATNGTTVMTTTKAYDYLNRLTNIASSSSSFSSSFDYQFNSANQRTSVTNVDGSYWVYTYDSMGQVTSGRKYWSDNTPVAGQQFDYTFDDIGNRKTTTRDTRTATYTPNTLNQYTSRTVPGYVNVLGTATNTATVSLWSKESTALYTSTSRKGDYFRGEMPFNNSTGALWLTITNVAALSNYTGADIVTNAVGRMFLPKTPETFTYDSDGNLTNDGRWSYNWDAENRLARMESSSDAPSPSKYKLEFTYDSKSRRTQKIVSSWNGSTYVAQSTNKFVYDGWNLIAILDANSSLLASFSWGTDASGTMQGAGGVGGLISMTVHQGTNAGTYFYCFDGNHNVTTLLNATNGAVEARYEYDPFLGILRATGRLAFINPFVGSTKFCDWETGFLYYSYRYYDPKTGRWLSRDPIEEAGGKGLYAFLMNNSPTAIDALGLRPLRTSCNCCCECAESITISNPQNKKYPLGDSVGHVFDVDIVLSYRSVSLPFCPGGPKFKWEEKSNRPPDWLVKIGAKPNEWYDVFELEQPKDPKDLFSLPESYKDDKWEKRTKTCEVPTRTIRTSDFPVADLRQGKRVLQFKLSIINPSECKCPEPVVKATAVQIIDPGASPVGTFTIPDPSQ